jgi:hypothetical protein
MSRRAPPAMPYRGRTRPAPRRAVHDGASFEPPPPCSPPAPLEDHRGEHKPHCRLAVPRTTPPAAFLHQSSPQTGRRRAPSQPSHLPWPSPATSSPELRRPRRPPPPRTTLQGIQSFQGVFREPGAYYEDSETFQGPCCKSESEIVKVLLLILVNCVENCRKIRKLQSNFSGFVVKNPTTFVILA